MKWLWRLLIAFIVVTLCFFIWLNHALTQAQLRNYNDQYKDVVLYIDDEPIKSVTALLNRDQHSFIDLSVLQPYQSAPFQLNEEGACLTIAADSFYASGLSDLSIDIPLIQFAGRNYVDINYLPYITNLSIAENQTPQRFYSRDYSIRYGYTNAGVALRTEAGAFAPQLSTLPPMEKVYIIAEVVQYYYVRTEAGEQGYIARSALDDIYQLKDAAPKDALTHRVERYGRLQWTFDYFNDYRAVLKAPALHKIDGLDGLLPNFFDVLGDGRIVNRCDFNYIRRAHQLGYTVQAGVANVMSEQQVHQLLSNYQTRRKLAEQLLAYCKLYQLDGIYLNFGELAKRDKINYLQFIKQLNALLDEADILLSVSIMTDLSDPVSQIIDYKMIAKFCDYVLLMAYEEHGADSTIAGSVASLPWTKRQLNALLEKTPNSKVILGIPTYMRVWTDVEGARSHMQVSEDLAQKTIAMHQLMDFLKRGDYAMARDSGSGQNYYEVATDDALLKVWAEDEYSVKQRLRIVREHQLAGVVSWRRGFESADFWRIVRENIDK